MPIAPCSRPPGYAEVRTPLLEDLGVFLRVGEGTDVVTQGDVRLRRPGRHDRRAAPRDDRRRGPGLRPAPPAARRGRSGTPRTHFRHENAAEGPAPPAPPARRRGASASADPDLDVEVIAACWDAARVARAAAQPAAAQLDRRAADRGRLRRGAARLPRARRRRARPRRPRPKSTATRCGSSTRSAPTTGRGRRRRIPTLADRLAAPTSAAHFDRVQDGLARRRRRPSRSSPGWSAASTTTPHTVFEFVSRRHRRRRSRPSAAAAATTAWSRRSAASPRPASASASGIERMLLACDAEGVVRRRPPRARLLRRRPSAATARRPRPRASSCAAAGLAADRAVDGRSTKAQMKAADRSGARLALIVGRRRARRGHRHRPRPPRRGRAARRSPAPTWSTTCGSAPSFEEAAVVTIHLQRPPRHAHHAAASCAPSTSASRSPLRLGRRAAASTASTSPSSTCATTPASIQCVVDGAADLRSEYVVRVTGTVRPRPEGTVNPNLATGEVELGDCDGRDPRRRPSRRRSPSTTGVDDRRDDPPAPPLPRPPPRADAAQPAHAGRGQQRVRARDGRRRASSRSRPRCSSRRRPRAPATSWCRRA